MININFIGPWRVLLGVRAVTADVKSLAGAKIFVETNFGPVLAQKIKMIGVGKSQSVWDNSNILLNGKNIKLLGEITFQDGDKLDLLPTVAGG